MLDKVEVLTYESVTNYSRAVKGAAQMCVMCGKGSGANGHRGTASGGGGVVIPRQNKDVCRHCDKAIWQHGATGAYFKWCKGCKNFLKICYFSQKLDAAKCDKCRERGRTSYLLKKRHSSGCGDAASSSSAAPPAKRDGEHDSAAAISLVELSNRDSPTAMADDDDDDGALPKVSVSFGRSLLELRHPHQGPPSEWSLNSEEDPHDAEQPQRVDESDGLRDAPGLLFELATIHSAILKLEHRAELVTPLEQRVAQLQTELDAALKREAVAYAEITRLKRQLASACSGGELEGDASKRPRLISFDAVSTHDTNSIATNEIAESQ